VLRSPQRRRIALFGVVGLMTVVAAPLLPGEPSPKRVVRQPARGAPVVQAAQPATPIVGEPHFNDDSSLLRAISRP
jgi:hypothetical protein